MDHVPWHRFSMRMRPFAAMQPYIPKSKSGPARVDVLKNNCIRTHAGVPSRGDGQAHSRRRKEKVGVFADPSAGAAKVF